MKQTVLHQKHLRSAAKMMDYQGWQIPFQFSDLQDECIAVRTAAGLFDVSYLGRIEVSGAGASELLQHIITRNMSKITEGTAHYCLICSDSGFILDDPLLFHLPGGGASGRRYLLTTNACNTEKIISWLKEHAPADVQIADTTNVFAQFALQGPQSFSILESLAGPHFKKIKAGTIRRALTVLDTTLLVSRTGYTGEHGYELFVPVDRAETFWDAIMAAGRDKGLLPCGFASRDILRLEMGYPLYGNDIDETHTPMEAGLASFVDFKKDFIGKEALLKTSTIKQTLAGFILLDKGVPKKGGSIFSESRDIGLVTSSAQSFHLRTGIGLGYVVSRYAQAGQEIEIEVRDKEVVAKIVDLPFYRKKQ